MIKSSSAWQVSDINEYLQVFLCNKMAILSYQNFPRPLASTWCQDDLYISNIMPAVGENPPPKSLQF